MFSHSGTVTTAALVALGAVAGCASDTGGSSQAEDVAADEEAEQLCRGPGLEYALGYNSQSELAASHPTRAGKLERWEQDRDKPDGPVPDADLRAASPDSFVALCRFEGEYDQTGFPKAPPPPSGDGPEPEPYRYLTVTVTEDPTDSHPVGHDGESDPVLLFSVSTDLDPEGPPPPDEDPS